MALWACHRPASLPFVLGRSAHSQPKPAVLLLSQPNRFRRDGSQEGVCPTGVCERDLWWGRSLLTPPSFHFDKPGPCVYTEGEVRGEM